MDKIFKNKFENFERKAPDHVLDNILENISVVDKAPIKSRSFLNTIIWSSVAMVFVVVGFLLLNNSEENTTIDNSNTQAITKQKIQENTNKKIQIDTASKRVLQITQINNPKPKSENKNTTNVDEKSNIDNNKPCIIKNSKEKLNETNISYSIVADRYICGNECVLKLDKNIEGGEWIANQIVTFQSPNSSKTIVHCSNKKKVLFTYRYGQVQDTFTIFFISPLELNYTVTPAVCGEENGRVEFNFPNKRSFVSNNNYFLSNNAFEKLIPNDYTFELKDNFSCNYIFQIQMLEENLKGKISFDALETRVDYPIYFSSDVNIEDLDYIWDFGDGLSSYEQNPEHKYEKPGKYKVSLQLIKTNCSETLFLDELVIADKKLDIPNIFTPNNDGENDEFLISAPQNLKSFEALILNRNGQLVYKWDDPTKGWDGLMMDGKKAQEGAYYYIIKGVDSLGKTFEYKSYLELRR